MAMVNMNNLLNGKDSRWLQLEVCREFQRNKCSRPDTECKFAHPPPNVEVQNGRVTACYDSIKGRCNREKPPCKYFHPPQHLKDQLLINGRNHLALKNAIMQQMGLTPGQPLVPGQVPTVVDSAATIGFPFTLLPANLSMSLSLDEHYALTAANPYLTSMPQVGSTYSPYFAPGPIMPAIMGPDPSVASPLGVVPQTVVAAAQQKMPRSDRLEMDVKSVGSFYYENFTFPGMVPYKRPAADKSGMPVYQPSATTYQQLMQLQQPFVPVSCEYTSPPPPAATAAIATSLPLPPASYSSANSSSSPITTTTSSLTGVHTNIPEPPKLPSSVPSSVSQTQTISQAIPPPPIPSQQDSDENDLTVVQTNSVPQGPDPAAIAKEVAQQNYAKAVKLAQAQAQVSNSFGINPLTALSYTGVSLNKHALSVPPPNVGGVPRYQTGLPFNFGLGLASPYSQQAQVQAQMQAQVQAHQAQAQAQAQAAAHAAAVASHQQSNLLAFSRPPPSHHHTLMNPYTAALLRPYGQMQGGAPQLLSQGLLQATQYPVSATPTVNLQAQSSAAAAAAAAAAQNNNNVVLQPYKKMKTT